MQAAHRGHLEMVKYLVQAGADKEKENQVSMV
jgi:ankyrin repeat protein